MKWICALLAASSLLASEVADFGLALYPKLPEGNAVYSPYSIYTCLAMAYAGAAGQTAEEMQTLLKFPSTFPLPPQNLHLTQDVFVFDNHPVLPSYTHTLETRFHAQVHATAFKPGIEESLNARIADQTGGHILDLFHPGDITESTKLILLSTLYFQGNWCLPFSPKQTAPADFHIDEKTTKSVPMMEQTASLLYYETPGCRAVFLPFADSPLVFVLLLSSSFPPLDDLLSCATPQRVHLQLPKFTLQERLDLGDTLKELGMRSPFTPEADFSRIDGRHNLFLSKVLHEAFLKVDEAGLLAAAATAGVINMTSGAPSPPPVEFLCNQPFLFLLLDRDTKTPIFLGRVHEPL